MIPHDLDAEHDLIGALILDPWATPTITARITPDHFSEQPHAVLYRACTWAHDNAPLDRGYQIIDNRTQPIIGGLAHALRRVGITDPRPYVTRAQRCAQTSFGYRPELLDRLDRAHQARRRIDQLHAELAQEMAL